MSVEQIQRFKKGVIARVRRFNTLRAAQRALAPSLRSPESLPTADLLRSIRDRLHALHTQIQGHETPPITALDPEETSRKLEELRSIDDILDGYARQLLLIVDKTSMAQFRAELPTVVAEQRAEGIALLDLCIEKDQELGARQSLVDYLVTLLCAERRDGRWATAHDPSELSPWTRKRGREAAERAADQQATIAARLRGAPERLAAGENFDIVVRDTASYKAEIAPYFFAPDVLRAIVAYNIALKNLREEQMQRSRAADQEVDRDTGLEASLEGARAAATQVQAAVAATATTKQETRSAFASPGLELVEEAIARRLQNDNSQPGPADSLAARMDLSPLGRVETRAFTHPSRETAKFLVRRTVAVGLILAHAERVEKELEALGIASAELFKDWVREVGERVQAHINELVSVGTFEEAQQLSGITTRFLYAPLSGRRIGTHLEMQPAATGDPTTKYSSVRKPERRSAAKVPASRARKTREASGGPSARSRLVIGFGLIVSLLVGGWHFLPKDPRSAALLTRKELGEISPWLVSGYRSRLGRGTVFFGTVGGDWGQLEAARRRAESDAIHANLAPTGVREVFLFDDRNLLQAHYSPGGTRYAKSTTP